MSTASLKHERCPSGAASSHYPSEGAAMGALNKKTAPAEAVAEPGEAQYLTGHSTPENADGKVRDVQALMQRPLAELSDDELAAVKAWQSEDRKLREVAGQEAAEANLKLRAVVAELDELASGEYELRRPELSKKYGMRRPYLDMLYRSSHPEKKLEGAEQQGSGIAFNDPSLWPDAVNADALFQDIEKMIRRFVVLPDDALVAVILCTALSYVHDSFMISPILCLSSPEKRCGKSTLLSVMRRLVARPLPTVNVSPAALFRAVEKYRPTLLIDEGDRFLRGDEENVGLLNSGHLRPMASVLRCVGDDQEPRSFSTWAPKCIALIGALTGTLQDRTIIVSMERKGVEEKTDRLREDAKDNSFASLRSRLFRWATDVGSRLGSYETEPPDELDDRAADNWRVLLTIAQAAGGDWPSKARLAAVHLSGDRDEPDFGTQLLSDIMMIFEEEGLTMIPTTRLLPRLLALEDQPWAEYRQGKPMTTHGLARLLRRYKIQPEKYRDGDETFRGYRRETIEIVACRYVAIPRLQAEQAEHRNTGPINATRNPGKGENVPLVAVVPLTGETSGRVPV